jgi:hypothetical protein
MAASPKKQLALDANLLLDLAEGKDFAHEFREEFQSRRYELLVPPTAAAELNALSLYGGEPQRVFANQALRRLREWKCQLYLLSDTKLAIAEQFGRRLLELRLVPKEEWNDGRLLGETSLAALPLQVTSDKDSLEIGEDALVLAFSDADLLPVHPVHPKRLLRALR